MNHTQEGGIDAARIPRVDLEREIVGDAQGQCGLEACACKVIRIRRITGGAGCHELIWSVVPICNAQQMDVRDEDLMWARTIDLTTRGGQTLWEQSASVSLFRHCDTNRARVNDGLIKLSGFVLENNIQFVAQLQLCPLDCPYCYLTREGVYGRAVILSSHHLAAVFEQCSQASVFHLMGGAPAIYLDNWPRLVAELKECVTRPFVFHSDFLLIEQEYKVETLRALRSIDATQMYAVNIKGVTHEEYLSNTRCAPNRSLLWRNLRRLHDCRIPFYLTFTNIAQPSIDKFLMQYHARISSQVPYWFPVHIVDYKALHYKEKKHD